MRIIRSAASTFLAATTICLLFSTGCSKNGKYKTYTIYDPVYSSRSAALASINGNPQQSVDSAGKLFIKGKYIYLNDLNKGIHILDNSDPGHPRQIAFLSIPGNQDIAMKGNILYADMYQDLLAIDISNPRQAVITGSVPNLFSGRAWVNGYYTNTADRVIVGWKAKDTTVELKGYPYTYPNPGGAWFTMAASQSNTAGPGTAGSMAAMVLMNNYLYVIAESHSLGIVDATSPSSPSFVADFPAGFDLETIYPFGNKLFLGSSVGVFSYDISNPVKPAAAGSFAHGHACDPVITDGSFAYVTLHSGSRCGGAANELDVVDISQGVSGSYIERVYPMTRPQGLAKDGNYLFVCDGNAGVKIYDAKDPRDLQMLSVTNEGTAYDVIAMGNNILLAVTDKGLVQYDYTDIAHPRALSLIPARASAQ